MKKWNRILAVLLAAAAIVVMLPMGSVQALKERSFMEPRIEEETIEQREAEEAEEAEQTEEAVSGQQEPCTESEASEAPKQETDTESEEPKASTQEADAESEASEAQIWETDIEPKEAVQIEPELVNEIADNIKGQEAAAEAADTIRQEADRNDFLFSKGLIVRISDDIEEGFVHEGGGYVKKAAHTITLTRNETILPAIEPMDMDDRYSYESISYIIYQKTDQGEIPLKEGSLEIPDKNAICSENKIEAAYTQAGNYCIQVKGKVRWMKRDEEQITEVELTRYDFSIQEDIQELSLKNTEVTLNYGDLIYLDSYVKVNKRYEYQEEYEILELSGTKNEILELGQKDGRAYIKAIGINNTNMGRTAVSIRLRENAFMKASDEKILTICVKPMPLELYVRAASPAVYLYDTLALKAVLQKDGSNAMEELLEADEDLRIGFAIICGADSCEADFADFECEKDEKDGAYTFYIPVEREYFKQFTKGAKYHIEMKLKYDNALKYMPYKVNTAAADVELLGRRAAVKLSAENEGIYDYRTYYKGEQPILHVEAEDTSALPNKGNEGNAADIGSAETVKKALSEEAEELVYIIASTDYNVVSINGGKTYTAKDDGLPLCINGVGTAAVTVTSDGNAVYTVEPGEINITVENSVLYDEDFVISIEDADASKVQSFNGSETKTGFEKWQEYLKEHDGWVSASVSIRLTEAGLEYYKQLCMEEAGQSISCLEQAVLNEDKKITEYTFWAKNDDTNADTGEAEDKENGRRSFRLGIDATAPEIHEFIPAVDYYAPASTEDTQYFPKSFVLTGSFSDATSGVAAIEYTTDINTKGGAKWTLLEKADKAQGSKDFQLALGNGSYNAIAVRAVDVAGNVSKPACLTNENGAFVQIIVDDTPPEIDVSAMLGIDAGAWQEYNAEGENWTNRQIRYQISEKAKPEAPADGSYAELYKVEYAYQSIGAALREEAVSDEAWQELTVDGRGIAELFTGKDPENPTNKNGCYYFRGVSKSGVRSVANTKKRILLWQKMADKEPLIQSGADAEKCHNEWYNKMSGTPVIDFAYPKYDTGVISGEYAAPITIHYNLSVRDEENITRTLADDKTATISLSASDKLSELRAELFDDGIYTLEYWTTDAAGNRSEVETHTYQIDCHEPTELKIVLDGEVRAVGNENALVYEKFYQNSISGESTAEYGISGKDSIKLLKAKKLGEWKNTPPTENAEKFSVEPNMRCLLYVEAVDNAGNTAEGWTSGIVVDNEAPAGDHAPQMIIEPEGANKHGFFNQDVSVKIDIKDAPRDGNSAGLRLVTGSVGTAAADTISDKELFSSMEESVSEKLIAESEGFSVVEAIDAKANEGNSAYITVNAVDRSGNMSTETQELKIDVTKPEIEITFDNDNAVNGRYYSSDRRAQISIKELNFDASLVKVMAKRDGEDFTPSMSEWKSDKNNHYAYIDFSTDGDYTLAVECTDLADNEAERESAEPFTIDKTAPRAAIALENGGAQGGCFNETQTAVIMVTEHNFDPNDFRIDIQPNGAMGAWEHKNDTHVIKVTLSSEGEYTASCDYKDLAGNDILAQDKANMPLTLVIDKTSPVIGISGVEDASANAGEVVPHITVVDTNADPAAVAITLTTGKGAVMDIGADVSTAAAEGGFLYILNGLDAKPDDIYYLTVNAADKAGNLAELTYRFSLNRRGSAYDLIGLAALAERYYNSYRNLEDIKIVEMNVDRVEEFALYMSYNADIIYGKSGSRPACENFDKLPEAALYSVDVSGNENTGYVYTYTIYRENFALEGTYRLGIYSKDAAGNEVNNLLKQNGEEIQFVIDNTMPRVVIDGVENDKIYDVESQEVRIAADDNFKLAEAELLLVNKDDEVLESWNYYDLVENEGDTALITISEHKEEVSLLYRAVDAAGNEVKTMREEKQAKADFLVTTDKLVQLVNKPAQSPIGRVIIIALTLIATAAALMLILFNAFSKNAKKRKSGFKRTVTK